MSKIKLVIEIDETTYNRIIDDYFLNSEVYNAIKNGIPLPKEFEDIKAEIKVVQEDIMYKYEADFRYGVNTVLEIIDKHIERSEE